MATPGPSSNEMLWYGLGCTGHTFLIPCGHPKGVVLTAGTQEKERHRPLLYGRAIPER